MKTLSRIFKFKLGMLVAIAVLAVATYRAFAQESAQQVAFAKKKFVLSFTDARVRNEADFNKALRALGEDQYTIDFKHNDGKVDHYPPPPKASIKTDKVTTSEVAKSARTGELTAIGTQATQKVTSNSVTDIQSVLTVIE